jgi:hypothetical protein
MNSKKKNSADSALKKLSILDNKQLDMLLRMLNAYQSKFYPVDVLAVAALNRSTALCKGFYGLIEQKNFICAASILRLQLDNAFRFASVFLVSNPHAFASSIMNGKRIGDFKDKSGKLMTDGYLVTQMSKKYPWITKVYETTCGYIHLSDQHILHAIESRKDDETFVLKMSATDEHLAEESFVEAIEAFCAATEVFHYYIEGWIYSKANPKLMAKIREAKQRNMAPNE